MSSLRHKSMPTLLFCNWWHKRNAPMYRTIKRRCNETSHTNISAKRFIVRCRHRYCFFFYSLCSLVFLKPIATANYIYRKFEIIWYEIIWMATPWWRQHWPIRWQIPCEKICGLVCKMCAPCNDRWHAAAKKVAYTCASTLIHEIITRFDLGGRGSTRCGHSFRQT